MYQGRIIKPEKIAEMERLAKESTGQNNGNMPASSKQQEEVHLTLEEARKLADQINKKAIAEAQEIRDNIIIQAQEQAKIIMLEKALELQTKFTEEIKASQVKLGLIVANCVKKIIGQMPKEEVARNIIKTALEEYGIHHAISIRVSANDFDAAWWKNWDFLQKHNIDDSIFERDSSLEDGRYIIDFAGHEMDVGLITQIESLKNIASERDKDETISANNERLNISNKEAQNDS